VSKTFRPYEPNQYFLMPVSMIEERGYPPSHPAMMARVLLYAYCIGVPSSRKIEKRLCEDIAFRVLAANNTPDFRTISDFRKGHLKALAGVVPAGAEAMPESGAG